MAKTEFKVAEPKKATLVTVKKTAKSLDEKSAAFHIPAEKGKVLTLTGEFFEQTWESYEGSKKTGSGTTILVGVKELPKPLRLSFFRTKVLKEEEGNKLFKACFDKEASFEEMIDGLTADKKVKVCREDYVFPGRASARSIDTLDWAE